MSAPHKFRGTVRYTGRMHFQGKVFGTWEYRIMGPDGQCYGADGTGSWKTVYDDCKARVDALNLLFDGCDTGLRVTAPEWLND